MRLSLLTLLVGMGLMAQEAHWVELAWTYADPAATFNVYRAPSDCSGTPTFAKITATPISPKTYNDRPGPTPGNYCYVVTAVVNSVESAYSNSAHAAVPAKPPTAVVATSTAPGTADIVWTDTINSVGTTYSVWRAAGLCSGSPVFSKIANGLTVKVYADNPAPVGNQCYAVTATTNGMESGQSNTSGAAVAAPAPTGTTAAIR